MAPEVSKTQKEMEGLSLVSLAASPYCKATCLKALYRGCSGEQKRGDQASAQVQKDRTSSCLQSGFLGQIESMAAAWLVMGVEPREPPAAGDRSRSPAVAGEPFPLDGRLR